jgi:hypothetical protein
MTSVMAKSRTWEDLRGVRGDMGGSLVPEESSRRPAATRGRPDARSWGDSLERDRRTRIKIGL